MIEVEIGQFAARHQFGVGQTRAGISEVCLAMARAAATVSRIASGPVAEVLAEPLRCRHRG